jgi:hypothetical protein
MIYEHLVFQDYLSFGLSPLLFITMSLSIWIGLNSERRKTSLFNWIVISLLLISIDIIDGFLDIYSLFIVIVLNIYNIENLFYYIIIFRTLSAILIYVNIKNRNMKEWLWTFFAFCFPVFALPTYFIIRNKKEELSPKLATDTVIKTEEIKAKKEVQSSCPTCKSPNTRKLSECEYCGTYIEIN